MNLLAAVPELTCCNICKKKSKGSYEMAIYYRLSGKNHVFQEN
jgi:hypothetical protein